MREACTGICKRDFQTFPLLNSTTGWPKCRHCNIRINYEGIHCPCCGQKLSLRVIHTSKRRKEYVPALVQWSQRNSVH